MERVCTVKGCGKKRKGHGLCQSHYDKQYFQTYYTTHKDVYKARRRKLTRKPLHRFSSSKSVAKRRNLTWNLTLEQFTSLLDRDCYYCNGFFPKSQLGVGLDRIDNDKGYTVDNVLPCCGQCNQVKMDTLTRDETKAAISLIIEMRTMSIKTSTNK